MILQNGNLNLNSCHYIPIQKIHQHVDWKKFKLLIWDLDGTLYDMAKIKRKIQQSCLFSFKNTRGVLNYLSVIKKLEAERLKGEFHVSEYQHQFDELQKFINSYLSDDLVLPAAKNVLDIAKVREIPQVVISDFPIADKLKRLKLDHYFIEALGCSDELNCWKPHVRIYQAMEDLLIEHIPFAVIGDRVDTDGELFNLLIQKLGEVKFL